MRTLLAAIVIGFLASAAGAEEIQLGVRTGLEYDSNLFNAEENEVDDTAVRVTPMIGLRRTQGRLVYDVRYRPRWETWLDGSAEDNWDQNVFGRISYQVSPRTTLRATERFLMTKSLNRAGFISDPASPGGTPITDVATARQEITRNMLAIGADHMFSPRLRGSVDFGYDLFRTDREDRFDSDVLRGSVQGSYALSARNRVGAGFMVTSNDVKDTNTQNGSQTLFYNLFATWIYQFDPTMTLDARAGPTFIDAQQVNDVPTSATVPSWPFRPTAGGGLRLINSDTCPTTDGQPFLNERCDLFGQQVSGPDAQFFANSTTSVLQADDGSGDDLQMTIFATIRFTKTWEHVALSLGYRRTDSSASGVGQSTVLDFLDGGLTWTPTPMWQVKMVATFANRESASSQGANVIGLGPPESVVLAGPLGITPYAASPAVNLRRPESDNLTSIQTYTASVLVYRYIGKRKRARVFASARYLTQDGESFGNQRQFDDYRIAVGFQYLYDWMKLW